MVTPKKAAKAKATKTVAKKTSNLKVGGSVKKSTVTPKKKLTAKVGGTVKNLVSGASTKWLGSDIISEFKGNNPSSPQKAGGRHRRRMNPMNSRAARRAAARLKSSVKLLRNIEKLAVKAVPQKQKRSSGYGSISADEARRALRT
jgi:hypothetical protein